MSNTQTFNSTTMTNAENLAYINQTINNRMQEMIQDPAIRKDLKTFPTKEAAKDHLYNMALITLMGLA